MRLDALTLALRDMWSDRPFVIEGASDQIYLNELDRRLGELSARRRVFVSAAHELSHHARALNAANNTGMVAVHDALVLVARLFGQLTSADRLPSFTGDATPPATIVIPKHSDSLMSCLPSWATRNVAEMLSEAWPDSNGAEAVNPTGTRPQITFRLSIDTRQVLGDLHAAVQHLINALIAMARLCALQIWMVRRERSRALGHILACIIGCLSDIRAFALVIIAVCRHYGRRSAPDDHAPLPIRRHLVFMGSCPPI